MRERERERERSKESERKRREGILLKKCLKIDI